MNTSNRLREHASLWSWLHWRARRKKEYVDAIVTLALSAYTPKDRSHAKRVAVLAEMIAREMGLPKNKVALIRTAEYLHDIGRYVSNEYTSDCWHTVKGADLVSRLPILCETAEWIRYHHTEYDGMSLLASLAHQKNVPIEAAILAVAEHLDALTHGDAEPMTFDEAVEYVQQRSGTMFHPTVVKALLAAAQRTPSKLDCRSRGDLDDLPSIATGCGMAS